MDRLSTHAQTSLLAVEGSNEPESPKWTSTKLDLPITKLSICHCLIKKRWGAQRGGALCVQFPCYPSSSFLPSRGFPCWEVLSESPLSYSVEESTPPPPTPSKCLPHSQSLVCMFWINECVEWRPSLIAPSLKLASPDSKLLCVRGWTKPPYSFAVTASLFGLCHVPFDMISGVHWPALASLATRGYFRPTLDGSSLVMPALRPLCPVTSFPPCFSYREPHLIFSNKCQLPHFWCLGPSQFWAPELRDCHQVGHKKKKWCWSNLARIPALMCALCSLVSLTVKWVRQSLSLLRVPW